MHPLSKLIVDTHNNSQLTERQQKIFQLAEKNDYNKLLRQLDGAIDREDIERVNLLLDAIQAAHRVGRMLATLPARILQEVSDNVRHPGSQANTEHNDRNN